MFDGIVSKLSEATMASATTITPLTDIVVLTGTTAIATIKAPNNGGFSSVLFVVATDAAGTSTVTTGNIALAVSITTGKTTVFVYSAKNAKWYPGAIS